MWRLRKHLEESSWGLLHTQITDVANLWLKVRQKPEKHQGKVSCTLCQLLVTKHQLGKGCVGQQFHELHLLLLAVVIGTDLKLRQEGRQATGASSTTCPFAACLKAQLKNLRFR